MNTQIGSGFTEPGINPDASKIKGFFDWQGNNLTFSESAWLSYLIIALVFIAAFFIMVYKKKIYSYINLESENVKIFKIFRSKESFFQLIGIIGMFFLLMRVVILAVGDYPNKWEFIPLHFCRMFIFLIFCAFILKKSEWVKYFAFFSIGGAVIGLFISDLSNSAFWGQWNKNFPVQFGRGGFDIGLDSYIFWDYFLAHSFAFLMPIIIFTTSKTKIVRRDSWISIISLLVFTIFIFFLNWILDAYASPEWKSNYFYVGQLQQITVFGVLNEWPFSLITYIVLGFFIYYLIFWIWILQDKIDFIFSKKIFIKKIAWIKSLNFLNYKRKKFFENVTYK